MEEVRIPGVKSGGGINSMLAPRTGEQQRVFSGRILEAKGELPKGTTEQAEWLRKIPIAGGLIHRAYICRVNIKKTS